jgi:hypothetical protein
MIGGKKRKGFTVMEALVVLAAFSSLMILISDIYVQTTRFGRSIVLRSKVQADARNTLEALARAIRVSSIDYASWGGTLPVQPTEELRLINPATGSTSRIGLRRSDEACHNDAKSYPCITVSTDNGLTWAPLSPKGATVETLSYLVSPSTDPFAYDAESGSYNNDQFPFVTILMEYHGTGRNPSEEWSYALQTTVTPRIYVR